MLVTHSGLDIVDGVRNPFKEHPSVFVVEDEISIAKMMSVILKMNLFDAFPFSGPKADLAARINPRDFLISDIAMQGMTGIEPAVTLQREIPSARFYFFPDKWALQKSFKMRDGRATVLPLYRSPFTQRNW